MIKFKDGFSSESYYPDSNYYLNQDNTPKETPVSEDRISYMGGGFRMAKYLLVYRGKNKWKACNDRLHGGHY